MANNNLYSNNPNDEMKYSLSSHDGTNYAMLPKPTNRLPIAIAATVVGVISVCMCFISVILGGIAIVFATQADTKYRGEDYIGAQSSSRIAFVLSIISLSISLLSLILLLFFALINGIGDVSNIPAGINSAILNHLY